MTCANVVCSSLNNPSQHKPLMPNDKVGPTMQIHAGMRNASPWQSWTHHVDHMPVWSNLSRQPKGGLQARNFFIPATRRSKPPLLSKPNMLKHTQLSATQPSSNQPYKSSIPSPLEIGRFMTSLSRVSCWQQAQILSLVKISSTNCTELRKLRPAKPCCIFSNFRLNLINLICGYAIPNGSPKSR